MQEQDKISTRKKFIVWGAAVLTSLTAFKLFSISKKPVLSQEEKKSATVKMLSQDGKLVEVDIEKLYCGKRKKISDAELKQWVKNKHAQL